MWLSLSLTGTAWACPQATASAIPATAQTEAEAALKRRTEATTAAPPAPTAPAVAPLPAQRAPGARWPTVPAPRIGVGPRGAGAPSAPRAPQQVVMVIHRLRGWKLLRGLAANRQNIVSVDELPGVGDVHTNIVAGFVSEDGRTVMARLSQAQAEIENETGVATPPELYSNAFGMLPDLSDLTLVRSDGARFKAKFVGLDASTGLSLLEAAESLLPSPPAPTIYPSTAVTVGQRICLYAPAQVPPHTRSATGAANVARVDDPAMSAGGDVIYLSMGEIDGQLTDIKRAASGKPFQVTARASNISPAWVGAVVTTEAGTLVGIVDESVPAETRIVPAEVVRAAAARVLARRTSVPQPWLGARGDAVSATSLGWFISRGWDRKRVLPLITRGNGVLLTGVVPGTPAAMGGLRPGDVITSVGEREVRGVEEFSQLLKEAGVGSIVNFQVLRPLVTMPLNVSVRLSATQNPARDTREALLREAEARLRSERAAMSAARATMNAARAKMLESTASIRAVQAQARALKAEVAAAAPDYARRLGEIEKRLRAEEGREAGLKSVFETAATRMFEAEKRVVEAETRVMQLEKSVADGGFQPEPVRARGSRPSNPLLGYGLETIGLTTRSAPRLRAAHGLLVVSVREESPAAACGLRPGDVIETINGQAVTAPRWSAGLSDAGTADLSLGVARQSKRLIITLPRQ